MVSILDPNKAFYWPEPFKLEKRLKDVLEQNVDEKYYLSERMLQGFLKTDADKSMDTTSIQKIGKVLHSRYEQHLEHE